MITEDGRLHYRVQIPIGRAWPHRLRSDWRDALLATGHGEPRLPLFLGRIVLVVASPTEFWTVTPETPALRKQRANAPSQWRCLNALQSAVEQCGFWIWFAALEVEERRREQPVRIRPHYQAMPAA